MADARSMCSASSIDIWTWRELRASCSRRTLDARVRRGELRRLRRGVYAADTACPDAVEAAEHGGSLGCETAARHLGVWVLDDSSLHVWLRARRHHHGHTSRECDCVRHWDEGPSAETFGLPAVPRILLQIYRCRGGESFFVALESARRLGLIERDGLRWAGKRDRRGRARSHRLLAIRRGQRARISGAPPSAQVRVDSLHASTGRRHRSR